MKNLIIYIILLLPATLLTQELNHAEYFFDIDPGIGNGDAINFTSGDEINLLEDVSVSSLANGFHVFCIRYRDESGTWSLTDCRQFYIQNDYGSAITKAEYFFDDVDPGIGNGTDIPVVQGSAILLTDEISVEELNPGFHKITLRYKDENGRWSLNDSRLFVIDEFFNISAPLISGEYFFDDDPGVGNGTAFDFEDADQIHVDELARTNEQHTFGEHDLSVRFVDEFGQWSHTLSGEFDVNFEFIRYKNTVSFILIPDDEETYEWDFGDGNTSNVTMPSHTYAEGGDYEVCLTVTKDGDEQQICRTVSLPLVKEYKPKQAANEGSVSIIIHGSGFDDSTYIKLEKDTGSGVEKILPFSVNRSNSNLLVCQMFLTDHSKGKWDLHIIFEDTSFVVENGFEIIESDDEYELWTEISGRDIRRGFPSDFYINFGNKSPMDAIGVPLYIAIGNTDEELNLEIEYSGRATNRDSTGATDSLDIFMNIDSLFGREFHGQLYPIVLQVVPAYFEGSIKVSITFNSGDYIGKEVEVLAFIGDPLFEIVEDEESSNSLNIQSDSLTYEQKKLLVDYRTATGDCIRGILTTVIGTVPGVGCVYGLMDMLIGPLVVELCVWENDADVVNALDQYVYSSYSKTTMWKSTVSVILTCIPGVGMVKAISLAKDFLSMMMGGGPEACVKMYKLKKKVARMLASFDPNEKYGPFTYEPNNYIKNNQRFDYIVYFENVDSAQAPAVIVFVTDTLEKTKLDISTFQFKSISFGDTLITLPPGLFEYTLDIDLRPEEDMIVRINAKCDTLTGVVFWQMLAIDPQTMKLITDADSGFLPPNENPPEGEGFVSYSIDPIIDLVNGTEIRNKSYIIFDRNEPIITNEWLNTIDNDLPTSSVSDLDLLTTSPTFTVEWQGSDPTSLVEFYDIYVSINDDGYGIWQHWTDITDATFNGTVGDTYKFYSIAYDVAGNIEADKLTYEATTTVIAEPPTSWNFAQNTGSSATIIVPANIEPKIGDRDFQDGDLVGAFYSDGEQNKCAGYGMWLGEDLNITVWGDDPVSLGKDGFYVGEDYQIMVWDAYDAVKRDAEFTIRDGDPTAFTPDAVSYLDYLHGIVNIHHLVGLNQGWNLISSYVNPIDLSIVTICNEIQDNLLLLRNNAGDIYFPSLDINTIGSWNIDEGYKVYMTEEATLDIFGVKIMPEETPLELAESWNWIAYLRDSEIPVTTAVADIEDDMLLLKDIDGDMYFPALNINTLGNLVPGQGYSVYMMESATLIYPANNSPRAAIKGGQLTPKATFILPEIDRTGNDMTIIIETDNLLNGSEIGIWTTDNVLVGSGKVHEGKAAITIWGDNEQTKMTDGAREYEALKAMVFDKGSAMSYEIDLIDIHSLRTKKDIDHLKYQPEDILICRTAVQSTNITTELQLTFKPNPTTGETTIEYILPESGYVSLKLYSMTGQLISTITETEATSGTHTITYDGSKLASGVYNLQMVVGELKINRLLVVSR